MHDLQPSQLAPMRIGILLILLTLLYGFGLGGVFGAFEQGIKDSLRRSAEAAEDTVYGGDQAKRTKVLGKSWSYWKRAHLHAGGMGAAALGLVLLLSCTTAADRIKQVAALFLGLGGLGYSLFWMLAGIIAPGLGSTGAAKESLRFLAIPASGMFIVGLVMVLACWVKTMFLSRAARTSATA